MALASAASRFTTLSIIFFSCTAALADCVDTVGMNASEKEFANRAIAALNNFLRPAPAGENIRWSDTSRSGVEVCRNQKKIGDFTVQVTRKYIWPDPRKNAADAVVKLTLSINAETFPDGPFGAGYGSPSPNRSANLAVNNVTWSVSLGGWGLKAQEEQLRDSVIAGLDREQMENMVGRPLPAAAKSSHQAGQTQAFTLLAAGSTPPSAGAETTTSPASGTPPPATSSGNDSTADTIRGVSDTFQKFRGLLGR